jgi:hypothetical protein
MRRVFYILMLSPPSCSIQLICFTYTFLQLSISFDWIISKKMQLCKSRTQRYASFIFICFISSRDFRLLVNVRASALESACVRERERKNKNARAFFAHEQISRVVYRTRTLVPKSAREKFVSSGGVQIRAASARCEQAMQRSG